MEVLKKILSGLSEDGKCLLTHKTDSLTYVPSDLDFNNLLGSNVLCIHKEIFESVDYTICFNFTHTDHKYYFDCIPQLFDYNSQVLFANALEFSKVKHDLNPPEVFEWWTKRHLKGILRIESLASTISIDKFQHATYLKIKESRNKSSIIKPSSLII